MKKIALLPVAILAILCSALQTNAQHKKMDQVMEDVFTERDQNLFTIRFFDALTGNPVEGAQVMIEKLGSFETDSAGRVQFPRQPDGLLRTLFKKDGYIASVFMVDVVAETIFKNRFVVSPVLDINQFRVVLDWDQQPADLDAHLVKANGYHLSYRNTRVLTDGTGVLDRDDMDGFGPETITVARIDANGSYTFFVHNFSGEKNPSGTPLSASKATVRVYGSNRLIKTFQVPTNLKGLVWHVFKVENGQVVDGE